MTIRTRPSELEVRYADIGERHALMLTALPADGGRRLVAEMFEDGTGVVSVQDDDRNESDFVGGEQTLTTDHVSIAVPADVFDLATLTPGGRVDLSIDGIPIESCSID